MESNLVELSNAFRKWLSKFGVLVAQDFLVDLYRPFVVPGVEGSFSFQWRLVAPEINTDKTIIYWSRSPFRDCVATLCVASSRLGRQLDRFPNWVTALRTAVCLGYRTRSTIVSAEGTTTHALVWRMACLLNTPRIVLRSFDEANQRPFENVFARPYTSNEQIIFYQSLDLQQKPVLPIDSVIISHCDEVRVLFLRKNGNIDKSLTKRVAHPSPKKSTWLLHDDELTSPATRKRHLQNGVIDWLLIDGELKNSNNSSTATVFGSRQTFDNEEFILHCTRSSGIRAAASRSDASLLDALLFGTDESITGPLRTLMSILLEGRLKATQQLTPGLRPVICFTDNRLEQLQNLRQYRKHLGRWDFEPFGLGIHKQAAFRFGARPVIYGDSASFTQMVPDDHPFFQKSNSTIGNKNIDWTLEKEWRVAGDLRLRDFSDKELFIFVPDQFSGDFISKFTHWPVVVINAD